MYAGRPCIVTARLSGKLGNWRQQRQARAVARRSGASAQGDQADSKGSQGPRLALLLNGFDIDGDLNVVSDNHATGFKRFIPIQAEILAAEGGRRGCADASVTHWIFYRGGGTLDVEHDFLGDAVQSEVAGKLPFAGAVGFDLLGLEFNGRVFFDIQKIRALEILIAHFDPRID